MLTYGFFNAVYTEGIPDRSYTADNLSEFFASIIGDGVSADIQDSFKVVAGSGMQVNLNPGFGWVHGYYAKNSSPYPLVVSAAPPTDTRIDAIVLRWSRSDRNILPQVLPGIASPNPQRPQIVRNADIYDLLLGYVTLRAGDSAITNSMITDTRADTDVCGIIDTFAARLLPDGSVTSAKIAANAVNTAKIAGSAVTRGKLATDALYSPFKEISGNYTLTSDDIGKTLMVRNVPTGTTSITITLPAISSAQGMPQGAEFAVFVYQANVQVKIVAGTGAYIGCSEWEALYPASSNKVLAISHRLGMVAIKKIFGTDSYWLVTGEYEDIS